MTGQPELKGSPCRKGENREETWAPLLQCPSQGHDAGASHSLCKTVHKTVLSQEWGRRTEGGGMPGLGFYLHLE